MSAINFVVRDDSGNLQRGAVSGEGGLPSIIANTDQEISLHLSRAQVQSYSRQGQALEIVLVDGRVIVIEGFFTVDGIPENRLFLSSGGVLVEVDLAQAGEGFYYASYAEAEAFGKWSPNDDLFFVESAPVQLAGYEAAAADVEAGMLAAPLLGGLGGFSSALGIGAGLIGGAVIADELFGGGSGPGLFVEVDEGVSGVGDVATGSDVESGVEIGGTGTPGGTVTVTIDGDTETTTVGDDGTWTVVFDDIEGGEYETDVTVTIDDGTNVVTVTETLIVDTIATVTITPVGGDDGVVNAEEFDGGVTLTGQVEEGASVIVTVGDMTYEADVVGGSWTLTLDDTVLPEGEYERTVTVTATDEYGNVGSSSTLVVVDTQTSLTMTTATIAGDGTVNSAEHAAGVTINGTAEAGATVDVTIGLVTHTVTVGASGAWSVTFDASEIAEGTYDAVVTAVSTDAAGNVATTSGSFHVDTEMGLTIATSGIEGDGIVNAAEAADGVTLTGTAEAGSTVEVTMNGVTHTVVANGAGNWSATWSASDLPSGETTVTVTAVATDASGNVETVTDTVEFDTLVTPFSHSTIVGGDRVINSAEAAQAITASGMVEAGSTVVVTLAGVTLPATVSNSGAWSVTYPAGAIAGGEYTADLVITATDAAGNTSQITESVLVDTVAGELALSTAPIELDDVVNAVEVSDGVAISGTATPGLIVTVTLGSATHQVVAGANGTWTTTFLSTEIPTGTYDAAITASITDAAGNSRSVSDSVRIDTQVDDYAFSGAAIEVDDVISAAEAADGVTVSGTVEPFSTIVVTFGTATTTVQAGADGAWSATFSKEQVGDGEYTATVTAVATDPAGNVATISDTVRVDTIVNELAADPAEGNGVANANELLDGLTLTGQVEPGSVVMVTVQGVTRQASVDGNGNWTVTFDPSEIAQGDYTGTATIVATDAVGNTRTEYASFEVDTVGPEAPVVTSLDQGRSGLRSVGIADEDTSLEVFRLSSDGRVTELSLEAEQDARYDEVDLFFDQAVPDGSQLVLTSTDDAGNEAATLFVLDEAGTNAVDIANSGLDRFDIGSIDLQFAENSELVLTAQDITDLTKGTGALTILGGNDDTVTASGAVDTGQTRDIDGATYHVYSLGDDSNLLISEDINVVI